MQLALFADRLLIDGSRRPADSDSRQRGFSGRYAVGHAPVGDARFDRGLQRFGLLRGIRAVGQIVVEILLVLIARGARPFVVAIELTQQFVPQERKPGDELGHRLRVLL